MLNISEPDVLRLIDLFAFTAWFLAFMLLVARPGIDYLFRHWVPVSHAPIKSRAIVLGALLVLYWFLSPAPVGGFDNPKLENVFFVSALVTSVTTYWILYIIFHDKLGPVFQKIAESRAEETHKTGEAPVKSPPPTKKQLVQDRAIRTGVFFLISAFLTYLPLGFLDFSLANEGLLALSKEGHFTKQHLLAIAEIIISIILMILIIFMVVVPLMKQVLQNNASAQNRAPPLPTYVWVIAIMSGAIFGALGAMA